MNNLRAYCTNTSDFKKFKGKVIGGGALPPSKSLWRGANAPGPNHFAGILDRVLKADRYL